VRSGHPLPANSEGTSALFQVEIFVVNALLILVDFDRAARTFRNLATVFTGLAESAEAHVRLATVSGIESFNLEDSFGSLASTIDASLLITPPTMSQELPATCDRSCPSPSSPSVNNSFNSDSSGTYETIIQREATAPGMAPGTHFLAPGMNSDDDPVVINYLMSDNIPPEKQWFVVVRGKTPGVYQNWYVKFCLRIPQLTSF
jgi:hypothetical protein